ncbi:hypothetical protein BG015_009826 [Linnemannia schmuckeri]|uniref:Uncharacterized protein n=1 Tax=Linnemannia schmuckeri TaxID=64567 RepID=A0A9P5S5H1_9FUNG|nr:hypothetical protein BG015_009826 [Linnemannia schmuckeri]
MDILLSEIQRLVAHDFSGPNRSAPYPAVLTPLYQRLQNYHIMLKNVRRKLDQHQQYQHQQRSATISPVVRNLSTGSKVSPNKLNLAVIATTIFATTASASPVLAPAAARLQMKHATNNNNFLEVSTAIDHILNLKKASSHFLVGPTSGGAGSATAKLPVSDARAIHGILASVNSDSSSALPFFSSSTFGGYINKSKKKKKDSLSSPSSKKENGSVDSGNNLETPIDIF